MQSDILQSPLGDLLPAAPSIGSNIDRDGWPCLPTAPASGIVSAPVLQLISRKFLPPSGRARQQWWKSFWSAAL
jgi:hypothetical protein